MANAKKLWEKGQTKQKTTPAASSGPAASAVNNIVKNTQTAAAGQQRVSQSAVDQMLADVQKSPYATVSEVIRAGQKPVTAQPVQQNKITAGRESTTPLQKQTGSASIKDRLAKMAQVSRIGKDSTANKPLPAMTAGGALTGITSTAKPAVTDTVRKLNSLAADIRSNENDLINMNRRLSVLKAKANKGDASAVDSYNQLADRYNQKFESYVANIGIYNTLYQGEYRDSAVRQNYAQREYQEFRRQNRDAGVRQAYQQRRLEEELSAPRQIDIGKEGTRTIEHTPTRAEQAVGGALSYYGSGFAQAGGLIAKDLFREDGGQGHSATENVFNVGKSTEVAAAARAWDKVKAGGRDWADGLMKASHELDERGEIQVKLAKQGLGTVGQALVDLGVVAIQMAGDIGLAVATGGSMLVPMGLRSYGNGYLTAEQMGYSGGEAELYGLGVAAVEVLSEKMFSVFSIAERYAKGVVKQEMSERVINAVVKRMANTPAGQTALNRLLTLLFSAGSEGLEEVMAGIMEPVIRKATLDHSINVKQEIDWENAFYEGLIGGILGGLGGAIDLKNTRPTYWKYYSQGINESIGRYEEAVKKHGLESKEALQAAKEVWDGGNKKMNQIAGTLDGKPVTYHQLAAMDETLLYGRQNEKGEAVQGPRLADSMNLNNYLEQEENARKEAENQRLEAARREEAARLEAEEKARVATEKPAQTATEGETVRLDTARSAQNRQTPSAPASQGVADLSGIPEEDLTQEEKDELAYGSGAVEDLGQYTGLAQRMGAPVAGRSSARVASSPAANVERTGNEDITRRVNDLAGRLQSKGLQSVERIKADPRMDGMRVGDVIFINERLSGAAAEAATMGHEVVHFAGDFDAQLINDLIAVMRRQGRDIDGLVETKREIYRKQFAEMGQAWDEEQMNQAYFEEEVAADFIGEICRADSETLDRIAAEEPGLIRRIINALRQLLARITGNQQAVYEQAIDRLNAALEKAGQNENAIRADGGVRYKISQIVDEVINNNGKLQAKYNQEQLFDVPSLIADAVSASSGGLIDIHQKKVAIEGTALYHEYIRHSDAAVETARDQIPMTRRDMVDAIAAILHPDYIESIFTDRNNPTQRQSFAYAKKDSGYYIVVEAVGGNRNPNIVPVMILRITENKWNDYIGAGKSLAEMLFENNADMLNAVPDNEKNKKNRVTVAQFAPPIQGEPLQGTPRSPRFTNSIAQPAGKNNTPGQQSSGTTEEGAALLTAMKQMSDQMTKLTEKLSERTGEAPAVAAGNDQDADYQTAVENGDMETARRMVEEAAKAAGYDLHLYHGSRKGGGFTVFRDWQYFTGSRKYAERYQERGNPDSLYEVFARSDRMFDTRNAEAAELFEQHRGEYGMGELQENGLPDWTDGYDISEMIEENELDYDGVILDEGGDLVDGEPVSRGPSYILRKSNQVKSAEPVTYDDDGEVIPLSKRFDRRKSDIRFSLNDTVETKGNLVALHNLDATKLGKALDLGGFPMPSIAVTKADIPHTNFGDITLVMDKSTVDPQADRRNQVYSADAWTPTFPQTEYEADDEVVRRIWKRFYDLQNKYGREQVDALYGYGNYLEDELNRYGGVAGIIERERDNPRMKMVYLLDNGQEVPGPTVKETVERMDDDKIAKNEYFVRALGEDVIREMAPQGGENRVAAWGRWWNDHGEELERAYREYLLLPEFNLSEEEVNNVVDGMTKSSFAAESIEIWRYLARGPEKITTENDYSERDKVIAGVDQSDYEAWLDDLFAGAEKNKGIYNGRDRYTASGNERSFSATHYAVTLENIARAMAAENEGNSKNVDGFYGVKTLRAGTATTFRSIPEMHALEDRLQHLTEEEAEQLNDALADRLVEVLGRIYDSQPHNSYDNRFIELDRIGGTMEEAAETGNWTPENVRKVFSKYRYKLDDQSSQDISDLLTDIQQMPVNIFEAKPKRAVRFDEVRAAIVPDSTDQALIDRLHEAGVEDVRTYEDGNDASRLEQVNAVPNVRFSLNDDPELERARQQAEYWKQLALKNSGVKDVDKLTRDLMRGYGSRASRSEMSGRMRELEEFLRSGGSEAEARATARQMAEDMLNKAAVPEDAADSEYHAAFRRYFRTNSISVPEEVKRGWPDGWGRFRKRYFGRLNLKNDGMDVTKIYREASQQWPDLLPSDEVVMRAQDQLETIAEVLDNLEPNMVNPYGSGPEFDAAVDSLAEDIISSLTRTEEAKAKEDTRLQRTEAETEELRQELGIGEEDSEEMTAADLMAARKKAEGAKRYLQKTQRRMNLTQQESELVDALIRGTLTEDQLPPGIDRQGVLAVCRAKQTYLDAMAPVDEYNRQRRERNFTLAEQLIENSDEWKDMKNGFAYARETARRIFYGLTKNTEEAQALIDTYVETIRKNEAAKNRMINEYNERIKKLGIDTKTKAGNKVSEAYAVQFVGEAEFMLGWLEQLPEGTTRDGLTYGEVKMLLDEFWRDNPNLDQDRVHAAVAEFRGIYDELFAMVNEARVLNGYAPIDYRKGYFPHFTSDQGDNIIQSLARGMGIGVEVTELPTSIAGTTHLFRPGIQWSGHMLRRTGSTTDYNVLEGWDRYIPAVANIIYHTEDIQKLRALETVIRRKYSDTTVQDEIDATRRSKDMTAEEINAKLDELFKRDTTQLNYFVQWLREYTNQLAGKKAELDRNVEKFVGRKVYRIVQKLENRVAANMLGGNISSAMTNFVPLFQAWGNVSTASMMRAMWDTGVGAIRGNGWRDGSSFLVNRKGYDAMYQTLFGKVKNALFAPFNWVDDFVSETVVRARYYDELRRGLSPEAAMVEADAFAGGVMADRAIGELPTIFNSKNPLVKVFTMFQVEVNNDLSHLLKDIPKDARDKGLAALFTSVLKYMLGVYMFNDLFEWLFGRRVSIDPLSMLNDLAGDATGYELPNMFESAVLIAKGEWQGWEEFENGKGGDFFSDLVGDLKEWLDDVPFISGLLGGGRFPIQAMLPEEGAVKAGYDALRDILKPEKDQENPDAYDWNKIYKTVKNPLYYWAMPAFGGQMRKIAEGIYAYTQHGSYSQTKQGRVLQYPILDYGDLVKAMVFGKTTTRYGKEWIESDFDSLTAPQTEAYINLVSGGSDPELIYQILHDLKGTERTAAEKAYALASANLDDGERIMIFGALDRDKEAENFADLMLSGLTFRQCADVLDEYRRLKDLEDQTAKGDEGTAERRRLSTEFSIFLADQGFDDKTVSAVQEVYDMQVKPIRYDWLTAAGIHREGAMELALDWSELEPLGNSSKVTDNQKIMAVADAGYLSESERHSAIRTLLKDDQVAKYNQYIVGYQIPVETYGNYIELSYNLKADDLDGDGEGDAYSLAKKKFAVINQLPLQPGQKTALAIYASGNAESTIRKYAPWL